MEVKEFLLSEKNKKAKEGTVPYLEISDVDIVSKSYILKEKESVVGAVFAKKNNVLVSTVRPSRGAITIVRENELAVSNAFAIINVNESMCLSKYIFYSLNNTKFLKYLEKNSKGATYPTCSKEDVYNYSISFVDYSKQKKIVNILDRVSKIIDSNKKQLQEYDQLIKSRFVEMFGDIFTNEKGYKIDKFINFVTQMNIGPFGSALKNDYFVSKEDGYCMVYEQKHAIRKNIDFERRYVDYKKYNELKRFEVGSGDLIVSCRGTIGECHILPVDAPIGIIHPSLMMIKPKGSVNPKFLLHLLERILERQLDNGSGVKMAIQAKELAKVTTIIPDRYLQDNYIFFVEQVDKLKSAVQQSLNETQQLFDSLMQEYFG